MASARPASVARTPLARSLLLLTIALLFSAWWLSLVAGVSLLAALVVNEIFIWHDLALFVFEGCWVVLGLLLLKQPAPVQAETATA